MTNFTPDAVVVEGLTKRFGSVVAVDGLSFTLAPGTITGFLGANGAGKTTTLRCLLGLSRPTAGVATFGGVAYRDLSHPARTVGAVLEPNTFHPGRRAREHLAVLADASGITPSRIDHVLELVGLSADAHRRVGGYSLGMRQRLALAAALLGDPHVLVLDEPANGLDPEGIRWLRSTLRRLKDEGRTVLVSSHVLAEVEHTVDDVVIISGGRLVAHRPLVELTAGAGRGVVVRSPDPAALADALRSRRIRFDHQADGSVIAFATTDDVARAIAAAGVAVYEMHLAERTLEDVFLALTTDTEGSLS